jgi:estrogen-related receptor ERR
MVSALLSCEPEPLLAINSQQSNTTLSSTSSSTQYKSICILSDLVDRELVATIGWAKQIPGFTDLILNDQMRLLQTTWAEVLSLSLAFRYNFIQFVWMSDYNKFQNFKFQICLDLISFLCPQPQQPLQQHRVILHNKQNWFSPMIS